MACGDTAAGGNKTRKGGGGGSKLDWKKTAFYVEFVLPRTKYLYTYIVFKTVMGRSACV